MIESHTQISCANYSSGVSYDMVLNPDLYPALRLVNRVGNHADNSDLTEEELNDHGLWADAEAYKYDEMYHSNLPERDIRRILALPEPLNLALPFLRNETEVQAHFLIQKYTFGGGEDRLRKRDAALFELEAEAREKFRMDKRIKTIMRRARRQQIREMDPEERNEEQSSWVALDSILNPEKYPVWDPWEPEKRQQLKDEEDRVTRIAREAKEREAFLESLESMTLSDLKEHVARKKGNSRGMRGET